MNSLSILSFLFIVFSCCSSDNPSGKIKIVNRVTIPEKYKTLIALSGNRNQPFKEYLFQDPETKDILQLSLIYGQLKLIRKETIKLRRESYDTYFYSSDSIFTLDNINQKISLSNRNGEEMRDYKIPEYYTPQIGQGLLFQGVKSSFLCGNMNEDFNFAEKKDRIKYYKETKPLLKMSVKDDSLHIVSFGQFPEKYKKTGDNYSHALPSACIGYANMTCVSFWASDSLYLYNDTNLFISKSAKSDFIDSFNSIPEEEKSNALYLKEYYKNEPGYCKIVYDPYEKMYYRIVKHRFNGELNNNMLSSVIILDKELNILKEVALTGNLNIFLPTPLGIVTYGYDEKNRAELRLIKIS